MVSPNEPTGIRLTEGRLKTLIQDERVLGVVLHVDSLTKNPRIEVARDFIHYLDQVAIKGHAHLSLKNDALKAYELASKSIVIVSNFDRYGAPVEDWSIWPGHRFGDVRAIEIHKKARGLNRLFSRGTYHPIEEALGEK